MQFPIVFTDLDGTLLDHHNYSFDAALPVIASAKTATDSHCRDDE